MGRLRILSPLAQAPLTIPSAARIYVPGFPKPNSKYASVVDELIGVGIPRAWIMCRRTEYESVFLQLGRLAVRLPWAFALIYSLKRRARNLDRSDVQTIIGRELFRRVLRRKPDLLPVIISDVSPNLHMLWSAASVEGNRAVWWQDDFHHSWRLPYAVRAAAVLNEAGLAAAAVRLPQERIFRRPTQEPASIRPIPDRPRVGVATNALFNGSPTQQEALMQIRKYIGNAVLHLRLHPTSSLAECDSLKSWIVVAPAAEPIEEFASRLDLAVVGNSAIQLKLVQRGVPVVHVSGLDSLGFDTYGYVRDRIVFGCETVPKLRLQDVKDFYQNNSFGMRLRHLTYLPETAAVQELHEVTEIL